MHLEKYLKDIYYTLRGMFLRLKWLWLIVISPICLIVPLLSRYDIFDPDEYSKYFINDRLLKWLPVGIAAGMFSLFDEDMNGVGRELLYVSRGMRRRQMISLLVIYNLLFLGSYFFLYKDSVNFEVTLDYGIAVCFKCVLETVCSVAVIYALFYISRSYTASLAVFVAATAFSLILDNDYSTGVYAWNYLEYSFPLQMLIMVILSAAGFYLGYQGELNYMGGSKRCGRAGVPQGKDNKLQAGQEGRMRKNVDSICLRMGNIWRIVYKFLWLSTVLAAGFMFYIQYQLLREPDTVSESVIERGFTYFYPVLVMFFLVLVYQEIIEGAGREMIYLCQRMHMLEGVFVFLICSLYLMVSVLVFYSRLPNAGFTFLKYLAVLFCFSGAGYGMCYLFRNITLMILGELAVYLASITNPFGVLYIFDLDESLPKNMLGYFIMTRDFWLVGLAGIIIGLIANYRYQRY